MHQQFSNTYPLTSLIKYNLPQAVTTLEYPLSLLMRVEGIAMIMNDE